MSDIWIEVRHDDSCMWQLKGRTWDEEPKLEVLQEVVDGYIAFVPDANLGNDVIGMIVNEEGMIRRLPVNELATLQLTTLAYQPIFGNVVMKVDEEYITKDYWLRGEEE
tara:strand:- start:8000 stop:8326 length:327 start_codon:yes stop_codon:yes gene_type:complete